MTFYLIGNPGRGFNTYPWQYIQGSVELGTQPQHTVAPAASDFLPGESQRDRKREREREKENDTRKRINKK